MLEEVINLKDEYQQAIVTMGDSGIAWIDLVFRVCVILLVEFAADVSVSFTFIQVHDSTQERRTTRHPSPPPA